MYLYHPGGTNLGKTIHHSYDWPWLITQAALVYKQYTTCQRFKKSGKLKYNKNPAKQAEVEYWVEVRIDLIGPYEIKIDKFDDKQLLVDKRI